MKALRQQSTTAATATTVEQFVPSAEKKGAKTPTGAVASESAATAAARAAAAPTDIACVGCNAELVENWNGSLKQSASLLARFVRGCTVSSYKKPLAGD